MEWKFDEYDESFACLEFRNSNVKFVVRRNIKVPEMFEVVLYYSKYSYNEIKLCYSKEEAMSFVEDLVKEIKKAE